MGALPPLETPTRKGGTLPLHGAHTAFSCYPALWLYRLSKSQRGIDVVSLTLGKSPLPLAHGRVGDEERIQDIPVSKSENNGHQDDGQPTQGVFQKVQAENGFILGLPLANDQTRQHIDTDSNNSQPKKPFVIDGLWVEKLAYIF